MIDQRRKRRRPFRHNAWVLRAPQPMQRCSLSDVSEAGARIDVEDARAVPDHFMLLLSKNGSARRVCRVIWRRSKQVGVIFERSLAEAEKHAAPPLQPALATEPAHAAKPAPAEQS